MPSEDGPRLSPTTPRDGLFFNAFEDRETTTSTSFMAPNWQEVARTPRKRRPALRRRVSDAAPSASDLDGELHVPARPLGHSRSQTQQGGGSHLHPLGNATIGPDAFAGYSSSTRPHLSRIMNSFESPADSDVEGGRKASSSDAGSFLDEVVSPEKNDNEKTVLVHEVSATDSLAGVALKYGITMGELRKANHLWASDSIHLRKVLYIPLDGPSHPNVVKPLIDLEEPTSVSPSDPYHGKSYTSTIRRVPASQLSFFPPPSKPSAPPSASSDDVFYDQSPYASSPSFKRPGSGSGSGSPAQTSRALTSILTAFPISASTRDTIIARLSFDSERNSISDDQEHELEEVRTSSQTERPNLQPSSSSDRITRRTTPSSRSHPRSHLISSPQFAPRSISPSTPVDHRKSWTHSDATEPLTTIRTVQLEPSPAMRVPLFTVKPKLRQGEPGFEPGARI